MTTLEMLLNAVEDGDNSAWNPISDLLYETGDERANLIGQLLAEDRLTLAHYVLASGEFEEKVLALALHLDITPDEIKEDRWGLIVGKAEYLVYDEDEAYVAVEDSIRDSLWAFSPGFLEQQTGIPSEMFEAVQEQSENGNDAVLRAVEQTCGLEDLVESAIAADGRGHFLSHYDGNEEEVEVLGTTYYIYRVN